MKPLNLNKHFVGRVLTRQVNVGLPRRGSCTLWVKPDLRLQNLTTIVLATFLLASPAAAADKLGRLFFTPEQRVHLDYDYARNAPTEGSASPFFTVNGIVQKHGGPRTVWINGMSQNADSHGERNPTAHSITVPGKSRPVKLKVGDKILLGQPAPSNLGSSAD